MSIDPSNTCLHCKNTTYDLESQFCCNGCEFAYKLINKIGLGNYYNARKIDPNTRKIKPENHEKISIAEFVTLDKNSNNTILLAIDGSDLAHFL